MGTGRSGLFHRTKGSKKEKNKIFSPRGCISFASISERREKWLGKSVAKIENELHKNGYITQRRPSVKPHSKAKIIVVLNTGKDKNISQIQVSPGSKRHGNVPYVKISTTDIGKIKIIGANQSEYKTDGKENAKLLFRRNYDERKQ